jgi:hypothetical protein
VYSQLTVEAAQGTLAATRTPTLEATDDSTPTVSPSPTPPDTRTGNGAVVNVPRCGAAITVDGDPADWNGQSGIPIFALVDNTFGAGEWLGTDDASAVARLCWTDQALHLFVEVADDIHVQTRTGGDQWQGDEVELMFDGSLQTDFYDDEWSSDDTQLGLSPGDFAGISPSAFQYQPRINTTLLVTVNARRPFEAGGDYLLEAAIPWTVLRTLPDTEASYGFCLALSDNDHVDTARQDSMVSHCPKLIVPDPTTYTTLKLLP